MSKELGEMKRHAVPAIAMSLGLSIIAILVYSSFEAAKDRTVQDMSDFMLILPVVVIFQSLIIVGSRKPWVVLPFIWLFLLLLAPIRGFQTMGMISKRYLREEHMHQITILKVVMAVVLPFFIALACDVYLRRKTNHNADD